MFSGGFQRFSGGFQMFSEVFRLGDNSRILKSLKTLWKPSENLWKPLKNPENLWRAEDEKKEIIEDLILAAHNDAKSKLKKKTSDAILDVTGGMQLPEGFKFPF